ncbi:MAG: TetR/AcrR family transcriptional regulator [Thermoplasmata archaeon]|nr:TetR/AcrR family transcriptional regulator [Thermoplasmata archaeon]
MLPVGYILTRIQIESKLLLPRAERRAAILHGAAEAFASTGFGDTSMEDVAAACGVTKLIVYRHFGSKEELYREILQHVFDHLGQELRSELALPTRSGLGPRTLLTVARDDPAAFTLLWRHAAHEPQFAAYAAELRSVSATVVRQLSALDTGDELLDAWRSQVLFGWLVEATLIWLEQGEAARDDEFVQQTSAGFRSLRSALTEGAAP